LAVHLLHYTVATEGLGAADAHALPSPPTSARPSRKNASILLALSGCRRCVPSRSTLRHPVS